MLPLKPPSGDKSPLRDSLAKEIALLGQMLALIVILQASTMFLPFIGDFFSRFTPLLLAIAIAIAPTKGFSITLGAGILLLFFAPKQIPILLFFDGPLGLWLGFIHHQPKLKKTFQLLATINLMFGVYLLTIFLGIPLLGGLGRGSSLPLLLFMTGAFIFLYVRTWFAVSQQFLKVMEKRGLLSLK